jgi:anti-sigma factor RsiW
MRSDPLSCEQVAETLAEAADGSVVLAPSVRAHVDGCLRCQAEMAQYRKLLRALHGMADEVLSPPVGLAEATIAGLHDGRDQGFRGHLGRHRAAYLGGLAATAAGVAGAIVLARTRRAAA